MMLATLYAAGRRRPHSRPPPRKSHAGDMRRRARATLSFALFLLRRQADNMKNNEANFRKARPMIAHRAAHTMLDDMLRAIYYEASGEHDAAIDRSSWHLLQLVMPSPASRRHYFLFAPPHDDSFPRSPEWLVRGDGFRAPRCRLHF